MLGTLFGGILITDFWGAYNAIETLAKQRCYFHMFTELVKADQRNARQSCINALTNSSLRPSTMPMQSVSSNACVATATRWA